MNSNTHAPKNARTVAASACMGAALPQRDLERLFKAEDLNAGHDLKVMGISDIFAALGVPYRPDVAPETDRALRAAFSTTDIPNVLADISQKFLLAGFGQVGESWREITRCVTVKNFKRARAVRLVSGGELEPIGKGGELKHIDLNDEAREINAETRGAIVNITREDLVNDDLGVLAGLPLRLGMLAAKSINKAVFGALPREGSAYGASMNAPMSMDSLETAYGLATQIKDSNGDYLGLLPNRILVATPNYLAAKNIYQSEHITGASAKQGRDNVMRGMFAPVSSPFLGTTSEFWLFSDALPLIDACFLGGRTEPHIETATADFNQLGIQMRCYYDYGVGLGEVKAALFSTGANA